MKKTGVIKNWQFHTLSISPEKAKEVHPDFDRDVVQMFTGTVVDDPTGRWQPGFHMRSTIVLKYDEETNVVETLNTMYTLQGESGDVYFDNDIGDGVLKIFY